MGPLDSRFGVTLGAPEPSIGSRTIDGEHPWPHAECAELCLGDWRTSEVTTTAKQAENVKSAVPSSLTLRPTRWTAAKRQLPGPSHSEVFRIPLKVVNRCLLAALSSSSITFPLISALTSALIKELAPTAKMSARAALHTSGGCNRSCRHFPEQSDTASARAALDSNR